MAGLRYLGASRPVFAPGPKTLTFALVAGAARGDMLVLVVAYVNADSCAVPAGWTRAVHLVGAAVTLDAYVRAVDENEPASVVLSPALATAEWQGELVAFRGGSPTAIIEASAIGSYAAVATPNAPAVSTQQAISLELCAWSTTGANVPVPPAGFTVVDGYASALASSRSFGVGFAIANATGALPVRAATGANPSTGSALSLVLRDRVPVLPAVLEDVIPGNIGLRAGPSTNIAIRFDEPATALLADQAGNLDNLVADAPYGMPIMVPAWTGPGRRFTSDQLALLADDLPDGNTLLQRDVTVRAILALDLATADHDPQTLICRGINNGAASERYCYGLQLQETATHPGFVEVRWFWQDGTGTIHEQAPAVFQAPPDGVFFALAATRRWESSGRVVLRYYAGGELLGELVSVDGDISGGTTGHTTIGVRESGGGDKFFYGVLDELLVDALELSGEELRQEHDRLVIHQASGVDMFAGLIPPGAPWHSDPGNRIGRIVKVAGQAIGQPIAMAEMMRALWLPDQASLDQTIRWERICGLIPGPRDSLDARRARVVGYLSRDEGFARAAIQQALVNTLDLAAGDIEILEYSNTIRDGFDALELERWLVAEDAGAWSVAAGKLAIAVPVTSDLRWEPSRVQVGIRLPIGEGALGIVAAQLKLVTYWAALPSHTTVGLWLYNRATNNSIWFGVDGGAAGARKIGYRLFVAGVAGAFVPLRDSPDAPLWIRVTRGTADLAGHVVFQWSTTGPSSGYTTVGIDTGITDVEWVGVGVTGSDVASDANLAATFDDFVVRAPEGDRPFYWYAYRNPALSGAPDLASADQVVQRLSPAHTYGRAIASKSVLADDPLYGLCDYGPAGDF